MTSDVALKEWAVVVQAVARGQHLLLLRKGGLEDPEGTFRMERREFFLYPTYEHQRPEYVRPEFHRQLQELSEGSARGEQGGVPLQVYAGVAYQKDLKELSALSKLERYHIWSPAFLEQRARTKPERPTQVVVIRAYRLPRPVRHAVRLDDAGCRSWVGLAEAIPLEGAQPVVDNRKFRAALEEISSRL